MNQILIMSSDPILKGKNIDVLVENGSRVFESSDALNGLLKIDKNGFDVIIVDEELNDTDGYEACKKIRQYSDIPIILLGSEPEKNIWARTDELGFDLYLKKPVSPRELMARVKSVLRRTPSKPKSKSNAKVFPDNTSAPEPTVQDDDLIEVEQQQTICPSCGAENYAEQKFCGSCAARLTPEEIEPTTPEIPQQIATTQAEDKSEMGLQKVICPSCDAENSMGQKFCGNCAARLTLEEVEPTTPEIPQQIAPTQAEGKSEIGPQKIICPNCGAENSRAKKICSKCATKLTPYTQKATSVSPLQETRIVNLNKTKEARSAQAQLTTKVPIDSEGISLQVWQDTRIVRLIDALASGKLNEINPSIDASLEGGFGYPDVDGLLDTTGEATKNVIEQLANNNILERNPFERFIVDPDGSFQLISVERCPYCGTGDINKRQLIEHTTCGNVGVDLDYRLSIRENKYVCPKCNEELNLLGTDYHHVGIQYRCRNKHTFPKPALKWRNIKTGKIWNQEQLGESWVYSYSLKPDKRDWLEFQLKPKAQLIDFLKVQGYQVEELAKVQGKSGAVHTIDIIATRDDGLASFRLAIGILTAPPNDGEIPLEELFKFDTTAYDAGVDYKVVIAMPKLSTAAVKFAERQKIGVFETSEPSTLISFLNSQTHLSPAAVLGRDLSEINTTNGPKGQLLGFFRNRGYEIFEKAKVVGKSGAEHVFDIFAQRDDAIVRPAIAVVIANADTGRMVGIDKVSQFDAAAYDSGIRNKVLVGFPQVSPEGKQLAKQQHMKVINEYELGDSLQSWLKGQQPK